MPNTFSPECSKISLAALDCGTTFITMSLKGVSFYVKCFCCILILGTSTDSNGQNIKLDEKRGFKDFIIGDNISKYQSKLKYNTTTTEGLKGYEFITDNLDDYMVFDKKFSHVVLFFNSTGTLKTINLVKEYGSDYSQALDELKELIGRLTLLFGNPRESYNDEKDDRLGAAWVGDDIILMCTNKYLGYQKGSIAEILITDIKELKKGF